MKFLPTAVCRAVLLIDGMRDNHCRELVLDALLKVAGVSEAEVSLFKARATVAFTAPCNPEDLIKAVARAGYKAVVKAVK